MVLVLPRGYVRQMGHASVPRPPQVGRRPLWWRKHRAGSAGAAARPAFRPRFSRRARFGQQFGRHAERDKFLDMFGSGAPAGDDVGERGFGHTGIGGEILENDAPFDEPGAATILTGGGNCVNRFTEIHSETSFWAADRTG